MAGEEGLGLGGREVGGGGGARFFLFCLFFVLDLSMNASASPGQRQVIRFLQPCFAVPWCLAIITDIGRG